MNTPATVTTLRHPLVVSLLCAVLLALAAPGARAGDPDDDWGLPKPSGQESGSAPAGDRAPGSGGNSNQAAGSADLALAGELLAAELDGREATLLVDRAGHDGTGVTQVDEAESAELLSAGVLRMAPAPEGARFQGPALLRLGGDLVATLEGPADAAASVAFLVLDGLPDGQPDASLADLLDGVEQGVVPAGVLAHEALGELEALDVGALHALVLEHGPALQAAGVRHVSVLGLALDPSGALRVAGVRIPVAGGEVEVETR